MHCVDATRTPLPSLNSCCALSQLSIAELPSPGTAVALILPPAIARAPTHLSRAPLSTAVNSSSQSTTPPALINNTLNLPTTQISPAQTHPSPHNHLPIPDPEPHTVTTNQKRLGPTAAVAASPNKPHQAKPQPRIYSKNGLQRPRRPSTLLPTPSLRRWPIPTTRRLRQPASSHGRPRSLRPSTWSTGLLRRPAARLQPAAHAVPAAAHVPAAGLPSSRAISG